MADSNFRGPVNSMGSLETQSGTTATIEPLDGPSMFYQGIGMLDPRGVGFNKDGFRPGQVPAFLNAYDLYGIDAVPQTNGSTLLAAAQVITAGLNLSLATVGLTNFSAGAASIAVAVPIIPQGTSVVTTAAIAIDFGFTTGTTTTNSTTVAVPDSSQFTLNQWVVVGNAGNSTATSSYIAQVRAIPGTTSITLSQVAGTAIGAPIGQANLFGSEFIAAGTVFGPQTATANSHSLAGRLAGGLGRFMNPREMLARGVSVQASASTAGTATLLVSGWDVWGAPMTELLTAAGTTLTFGKKAFKYINNIAPVTIGTTVSAQYTIGLSDVFGFPFRVDQPEHVLVIAGGTTVSNTVGITTAVVTGATNTSGDVRGTVQVSGIGGGTAISAVSTSNNVKRLFVVHTLGMYNGLFATPNNLTPLLGTAQV